MDSVFWAWNLSGAEFGSNKISRIGEKVKISDYANTGVPLVVIAYSAAHVRLVRTPGMCSLVPHDWLQLLEYALYVCGRNILLPVGGAADE
eukprot:3442210-Pyramimonas_sp.AAC.2